MGRVWAMGHFGGRSPARGSVVIPDLHGCPYFLDWVLEKFPQRSFIFLGDLINRGPDSRRVLSLALELVAEQRAQLLWGNHEDRTWRLLAGQSPEAQHRHLLDYNFDLVSSYHGDTAALVRDLRRFALCAQQYVVEGEMLCAHAARPRFEGSSLHIVDKGHLLDRPQRGLLDLPLDFFPQLKYSVHGHTVQEKVLIDMQQDAIYLDLGGYRTGRFAVWDSESYEYYLYRRR